MFLDKKNKTGQRLDLWNVQLLVCYKPFRRKGEDTLQVSWTNNPNLLALTLFFK